MVGLGAALLLEAAWTSPNAQHRLQVFWTLVSGQEPGIHPAQRWWWRWCWHYIYVPATLPVTLWLPTKLVWSLTVAAAMYGPLNLVSPLYLPLPQLSPSTSPTACWQGLTVRALVLVSTSWFGSGDLILATWQLFLGQGSRALSPPALHCHLTAALLSLLFLGNPAQLSCVPSLGAPIQLPSFYCHLLLISQASASLLACRCLSTPAFCSVPPAFLPRRVTSNSNRQ